MTIGLLAAGILVTTMVVAGLWLMEQGGVEPAARAHGDAPDPTEEAEVREVVHERAIERAAQRSSFLIDAPPEVAAPRD